MTFTLLEFQEEAVDQLTDAAADWLDMIASAKRPPLTLDDEPIPLLSQIKAITGAGKTPLLAATLAGIGPGIVFWTTKSLTVAQQTIEKLRSTYEPLLPPDHRVLDFYPSPGEWEDMFSATSGLTIWVRTVASWNDPKGTASDEDARLNLHRRPMGRDTELSPWEQLADATARNRPLWVVYDEGHGQTTVQLDQLLDLQPVGIFAASATPTMSARWRSLVEQLIKSKRWGPIYERAQVAIATGKVAEAQLLKNRVVVHDLNVEDSAKLDQVVARYKQLVKVATRSRTGVEPRALYVVERSNLKRGEAGEPPPTIIWRHLVERLGIPAGQVAVATNTKELPPEAEEVGDLSGLKVAHRHIIFNKKFEEGWDDPEAYIAYFDGATGSARRVKQLIGRVVRQPSASHFAERELNSAYLFVASPNERFGALVRSLQRQLLDEYGADENGEALVEAIDARDERLPIALRKGLPDLSLPIWRLDASGRIDDLVKGIRAEGKRHFDAEQLEAPGVVVAQTFELDEAKRRIVQTATRAGQNIKTANGVYLLDRVAALSRAARMAIPPSAVEGPSYSARSAHGSYAQDRLDAEAREVVDRFVERVMYVEDWDDEVWSPASWTPRSGEPIAFSRSIHREYTDASSVLNSLELEFARALDEVSDGWWARNFTTRAQNGYALELPLKVGGSNAFYPDFLWWVDGEVHAIDTTGPHILPDKVRGKLLGLQRPRVSLVTPGRYSIEHNAVEAKEGWTLVRRGPSGPRSEWYPSLELLLEGLRAGASSPQPDRAEDRRPQRRPGAKAAAKVAPKRPRPLRGR